MVTLPHVLSCGNQRQLALHVSFALVLSLVVGIMPGDDIALCTCINLKKKFCGCFEEVLFSNQMTKWGGTISIKRSSASFCYFVTVRLRHTLAKCFLQPQL